MNLYQIFHRGSEKPCLIISTSTLLATVDSIDSTEYHFIINLKDRQINGITFVRNSAILTEYGTVDEVELCLKILSTNYLCSLSLTLIFSYIEHPPRCRNYMILLIIQLQCYYIFSLKQYKASLWNIYM